MAVKIECDDCGGDIDQGQKAYCERCYQALADKIEELERQVEELEEAARDRVIEARGREA